VVWQNKVSPTVDEVFYATRSSDGTWSTRLTLSHDGAKFSGYPDIAIDSNDNLHVVWVDDAPGNPDIFYITKPSGGSWSTPFDIFHNPGNSYAPAIAIANDDNLYVV
jgi:hypothetical protein